MRWADARDVEHEIGFALVRVKKLDKWRHFDPQNNLGSVVNRDCSLGKRKRTVGRIKAERGRAKRRGEREEKGERKGRSKSSER